MTFAPRVVSLRNGSNLWTVESEAECRHEMIPAWCAICTGRSGAGPYGGTDRLVSAPFAAQYRGLCDLCDGRIVLDEMVVLVRDDPDDVGITVHEDCVSRGDYV